MRYQFTKTNQRFDGKKVYKTTYYPNIPLDSRDVYIITNEGDYLDSLSKTYYGNESFWWVIASANNINNGKLSISAGTQLRIPGNLPRILQLMQSIN